jgi:hypothetical protein
MSLLILSGLLIRENVSNEEIMTEVITWNLVTLIQDKTMHCNTKHFQNMLFVIMHAFSVLMYSHISVIIWLFIAYIIYYIGVNTFLQN